MHIVDMPAYFFPHQGGIEMMAWGNCREWVKQGHQVTLVTTLTGNAAREEVRQGIRIIRVPAKDIMGAPLPWGLMEVLELLPKVDGMRLHYPHPFVLDIGVKFAKKHSIPYILHMHGKEIEFTGVKGIAAKMYNQNYLADALLYASRITSHTKLLVNQSSMLKPHLNKIRYVSSGVDVSRFNPAIETSLRSELGLDGKKIILSLCVLRDYKGVHYLVSAMHYIVKKHPDVVLLVGGGGPQKEELMNIARDTGVEDKVRFLGFIPEKRKIEYFKIADVFVMPSPDIREGFGLVAADAVAMKTPCVVTSGAGISERFTELGIGHVTGPRNPMALADPICKILDTTPSDETLQKWRDVLNENNSWAAVAKDFADVFIEIVPYAHQPSLRQ